MSMRRYVLIRALWQIGALYAFVSIAYLAAWSPKAARADDPGYGGFLWNLGHGSLGRTVAVGGGGRGPTVDSLLWDATGVTLSLLLMTSVIAVSLGVAFALVQLRAPRLRPAVRALGFALVSLLPIWTALYLAVYPGLKWGLLRFSGYCPIRASAAGGCHGFASWLSALVLPALALAVFFAAIYGRWLAAAFRAAEAERRAAVEAGKDAAAARRMARRGRGLAFAKLLSRDFAFAIGFAIFVESVFSFPGLGGILVISSVTDDAAMLAGVLVVTSVLAAGVSFVVDVACAALDPRFRRF